MALKRHCTQTQGDGSEVPGTESKRRLKSSTVIRDVMNGISLHELEAKLEPYFRRVVREEVEQAIQPFRHSSQRSTLNQIESSGTRAWQLQFQNKLPSILFTGSKIESEDSESVKIVILDASSKEIIKSGRLSSIKIEFFVLNGDFGADDREDWTEQDFNANIVREREGKRPLVTGDRVITLRDGVGYIGDICFTDNSSWIRSRKFRLGARVQSISTEVRIREARSEAFIVKDHRGESYKKHHPPSFNDEIWRLERIAKDGKFHERLTLQGISTVKEFLQLYFTNPTLLRRIFGGGISNKTWETIIDHATECVLDDKLYMYHSVAERVVLVLNSVFKVVGAIFDGPNYQCVDKFNLLQMRLVEDSKKKAYENLNDLVPFEEPSIVGPPMLLSSIQADPFSSPSFGMQNVNLSVEHLDQLQMQLGSNPITTSLPHTYELEDSGQFEVSAAHNSHPMQVFSPTLRNSFTMRDFCYGAYAGGYSSAPIGSLGSVVMTGHLAADDNSQFETSMCQGNRLFPPPNNQSVNIGSSSFGIHFSRSGNPKTRWCKVRAAMKWGISVRRDVAAKKMARLLSFDF